MFLLCARPGQGTFVLAYIDAHGSPEAGALFPVLWRTEGWEVVLSLATQRVLVGIIWALTSGI